MHMWQVYHIINELAQYGIIIEQFNPLEFSSLENANNQLLNRIKCDDIDLFMTPLNESRLFLSTLREIKSRAIPSLLICFDNLVIPYYHRNIAQYFDLVWLTSCETRSMFESWGARTIFLPYAANPFFLKPSDKVDNGRICFIGTPYGSRINTINTLTKSSIGIDLYSGLKDSSEVRKFAENKFNYIKPFLNLVKFSYGRTVVRGALKQVLSKSELLNSKFVNYNPPVPLSDISRLYSKYSLSISSTTARNTGVLKKPLPIVNLRSFEIPMSGGLQICKYNSELAGYFEEDKEIVFYRNDREFVEKVRFYLADEQRELRLKMKKSARLRAIKDHSWKSRFDRVFSVLGLDQFL